MKSEAEVKDLLKYLDAERFAIGHLSTTIVAKPSSERSLYEQRWLHTNSFAPNLEAIDLQIALLKYILQ